MKNIAIIFTIPIIITLCFPIHFCKSVSDIIKIEIYAASYLDSDEIHVFENSPVFCEVINDELIVYDIEQKKDEKGNYWGPKTDFNGKQLQLDSKSKNYTENLIRILDSNLTRLWFKVSDNMKTDTILFGFSSNTQFKKTWYSGNDYYGIAYITNKGEVNSLRPLYLYNKTSGNLHFYCIDSNFIYTKISLSGNKIIKKEVKALNPDTTNLNSIQGAESYFETECGNYYFNINTGKGFLEFYPNKNEFISCGKQGKLGEFSSPRIIDNSLFVEIRWFISQMGGIVDYSKEVVTIYYFDSTTPKPNKIVILYGKLSAIQNGEEIVLSKDLKIINKYTFISLRDVCLLLRKQIRWRTINNSCLIERF